MSNLSRPLRQAVTWLLVGAVAAVATAGLWVLLGGGDLRPKLGITAMVVAGIIGLTGGTALARAATVERRALLDLLPERAEEHSGEGLTPVGIRLFVALPLFIGGAVLYGSA